MLVWLLFAFPGALFTVRISHVHPKSARRSFHQPSIRSVVYLWSSSYSPVVFIVHSGCVKRVVLSSLKPTQCVTIGMACSSEAKHVAVAS